MAQSTAAGDGPLNILHVLRAPLGGLFRHVLDLSRAQAQRGHRVGLIADSLTGGETAARIFAELEHELALGLYRVPIRRNPHPADIPSFVRAAHRSRGLAADIVHGHGSKGGVYARLPDLWSTGTGPARVYTPHGGSLNHRPGTAASRTYMRIERLLAAHTDLLLFESAYVAKRFTTMVGRPPRLFKVVHNGISPNEFVPVRPSSDAVEFLYVGELRPAKGVDTLIEALALAMKTLGSPLRACLVGTGPDADQLQRQADRLGISQAVTFAGALPARKAFERGRILVLPSRAESLPYVILEAVGACVPLITTDVGGIPEIYGPYSNMLLPPDDAPRLAARMIEVLTAPPGETERAARDLCGFVKSRFSIDTMVDGILAGYRDALASKHARGAAAPSTLPVPS